MAVFSTEIAVYRSWCRLLARKGFFVASVDFRNSAGTSIRAQFPEGLNDCVSVFQWLARKRHIIDIPVLGGSGGANIAISTTVRAEKQLITKGKLKGLMAVHRFISGPSVWRS